MSIQLDTATAFLATSIVVLLGLKFYLSAPLPLAHPFLLGRQSVNAPTRLPGQSPVYVSSGTGGMRPAIRPKQDTRLLRHVFETSSTKLDGGERGTWVKGGEDLKEIVHALRAGLTSKLGSGTETVAVLVSDSTDALLVTLALCLTSHKIILVAPESSSVPPDAKTSITVVISCTESISVAKSLNVASDAKWIDLGKPESGEKSQEAQDLLTTGREMVKEGWSAPEAPEIDPKQVALTIFSKGVALELTHLNITASLVSWLSLFPASPRSTRPSISDTILSFHHPATPYGFGLALVSIYLSASIVFPVVQAAAVDYERLFDVFNSKSISPPTLIFAPAEMLVDPIYKLLLSRMLGDSALFIKHARNGKLRMLRNGHVTQTSIWDDILFKGVRKDSGLSKIRLTVFDGPAEQSILEALRCGLGCPVMSTQSHSLLLAPVSASLMFDFQRLPRPEGMKSIATDFGHVGAPCAGVELKLIGDESEIAQGKMKGQILLRTPVLPPPWTLPKNLLHEDKSVPQYPSDPSETVSDKEDHSGKWVRTGLSAEMGTEGVLWLQ